MTTSADLVIYPVNEAAIETVRERYASLAADTPRGYEQVRLAIAHVRDTRVAIEKRRVELKADAIAYGRLVDSRARTLTATLLEIEEPLKAKKQAVDEEKARLRAEAEAARLAAIEAEIRAKREAEEAELRAVREAEEKRLAEERAAIEAEKARLAEAQAQLDAERAAEAARIEAARRAELERAEAEAKAERERVEAERAKLAEERRVEEERQRAGREQLAAERRRLDAERADAERVERERLTKIEAKRLAAEAEERDRIQAERRAAELGAMRPDIEKVAAFADSIRALGAPEVESARLADVLVHAMFGLDEIAVSLEGEVVAYREAMAAKTLPAEEKAEAA